MRVSDSKTLPDIKNSGNNPATSTSRRVSDLQRKRHNHGHGSLRLPSSNWFLRPVHQRVNSSYEHTLRKIRDIAQSGNHVKKRLPLEEEYSIRSFCPMTLGHMLPFPYSIKEDGSFDPYYSDFETNMFLKADDYFRKSLMSNGMYRDSMVPEIIEDDYLRLSESNNLNIAQRNKDPLTKRILVPSKVNHLGNELVADSLIHSPRSIALSKSAESLLRSPRMDARIQDMKEVDGKLSDQKKANSTSLPYIKEDEPYWMVSSAFRHELARLKAQALKLQEQKILDHIRGLELERLRPPVHKWYEFKDSRFHAEARRNSMFVMNEDRLPEIYQRRNYLKTALAKERS